MARPPGKAGFAAGPVGTVMRRPGRLGMPRSPAPAGAATDAASGAATCAAAITVAIASAGPRARR